MSANLEYWEYYLTEEGWLQGDSKYMGEPVQKGNLPQDINELAFMHVRSTSEMRAVGTISGNHKGILWKKEGCDKKIKELLTRYPMESLE